MQRRAPSCCHLPAPAPYAAQRSSFQARPLPTACAPRRLRWCGRGVCPMAHDLFGLFREFLDLEAADAGQRRAI